MKMILVSSTLQTWEALFVLQLEVWMHRQERSRDLVYLCRKYHQMSAQVLQHLSMEHVKGWWNLLT